MKRVLIFSLTYHPFVGGAEVALKEITDRLDPSEFEFEMITLRFDRNLPKTEKMGNVLVHRIGFSVPGTKVSDRSMPARCKIAKILFPFTAFFKARSLHHKKRFDITWAMMAGHAGFAALFFSASLKFPPSLKLWRTGRRTSKPVKYFLELQDGRPVREMKTRRPSLRFLWRLYRQVYLKADIIKCISLFIATEARKTGYQGPVRVIPNGVDVAKFSAPVPEEKLEALRATFNKKEGDVFLFTASRLVLSRGVEDVIQSLVHLPPHVKFLVAGTGEDREKLEHIARQLGVFDRVIFAGYVSHDELPAHLKISDIFVRPSLIEGMGNAFIEAFAAGIPIIGTPVGGIPDFLFDPNRSLEVDKHTQRDPTGLFCDVQNPESIAEAVERYLREPELRTRIVENAKKLAREQYDWALIARDMREKIFNAL